MATYDVGLRIGVEGDASFQNKLKLINQQAKELNSEMKNVTSAFDDNDSSQKKLAATTQVLTRQMDNQRSKIDLLKQKLTEQERKLDEIGTAYKKTVEEQGENSAAARKLANDYTKQASAVSNTKTQINNAEAALNKMNSTMEKSSGVSVNWGGVLKTAGAAAATLAASAAAMGVALGKAVVSAYGEFEQLQGGVQKIFGADAAAVMENAAQAFQTAGLSANQYMEQVTSFSASLIQSLGGNTSEAAKIADMAIRDMSDNANTFGTEMSSIQNAYQGFAKQNYTMLDNLRLGYGGTKSEMERLLSDAEKLTGIKYDINNLDDVYSALHVIQEQVVGIAGTTEAESKGTIQGSINRLKASLTNLVTGLGQAGSDTGTLVSNVAESLGYVFQNIAPVIQNLVSVLPSVMQQVLTAVTGMAPTILTTVTTMFQQVLETLIGMLPELMPFAVDAVLMIATTLIANLPTIIDAALQLILSLVDGLVQALPQLAAMVPQILVTIVQTIISNLPQILAAGVDIVLALIEGILTMAANLQTQVQGFVRTNIIDPIKARMADGTSLGRALVEGIWNGITAMAGWLIGKLKAWAGSVMDNIKAAWGISSPSKETAWMGEMMVKGLAKGISDNQAIVDRAWSNLQSDMGFGLTYSNNINGIGSPTFNITQMPGENGELLARRINRQLGGVYG